MKRSENRLRRAAAKLPARALGDVLLSHSWQNTSPAEQEGGTGFVTSSLHKHSSVRAAWFPGKAKARQQLALDVVPSYHRHPRCSGTPDEVLLVLECPLVLQLLLHVTRVHAAGLTWQLVILGYFVSHAKLLLDVGLFDVKKKLS